MLAAALRRMVATSRSVGVLATPARLHSTELDGEQSCLPYIPGWTGMRKLLECDDSDMPVAKVLSRVGAMLQPYQKRMLLMSKHGAFLEEIGAQALPKEIHQRVFQIGPPKTPNLNNEA